VEELLRLESPWLSAEKEESHSTNNSEETTEPEVPYMPYQHYNTHQRKTRSTTNPPSSYFAIDCGGIERDGRSTLMIKHIPNKYTEQMLFNELSRKFKNKINFLYLPLDPYNECNMGYAFVNFVHTKDIRPFYEEFSGRRWNKFNSGKIC
jgi:RNA recognition motif-containing protein